MCSERLGVNLDANVVDCAHRLGRFSSNKRRLIIAKFSSLEVKEKREVFNQRRSLASRSREHLRGGYFELRFYRRFIGDESFRFDALVHLSYPTNK